MGVLLYWAVPVVFFVLVGFLIWLKDRRPKSTEFHVDDFSKRIRAISQSTAAREHHREP